MSCSAIPHSKNRSGIPLAELDEPAVEAQVGVEGDEPRLSLRLLDQLLAVGGTSRCRSFGAEPCSGGGASTSSIGPRPSRSSRASSRALISSTASSYSSGVGAPEW